MMAVDVFTQVGCFFSSEAFFLIMTMLANIMLMKIMICIDLHILNSAPPHACDDHDNGNVISSKDTHQWQLVWRSDQLPAKSGGSRWRRSDPRFEHAPVHSFSR